MTIIEFIKAVLGIETTDFDMIIITFGCMVLYTGLIWIFAMLTIPINLITNAFRKGSE